VLAPESELQEIDINTFVKAARLQELTFFFEISEAGNTDDGG
jgi:hypothetical protein